jgi:rhodanese-related sulfurtransferase
MDTASSGTSSPVGIAAAALAVQLGRSGQPLTLDVRKAPAFDAAPQLIAGALRVAPDALAQALLQLPRDREVVTYCVHGHQVSQGAAQQLREAGFNATYLEGGVEHWQQDGLPVMGKNAELGLPATPGAPSRWITRERPKIDRIACPWLIRRFIDPLAQFLYVPSDQVLTAAQREKAIPYDVPNVRISHRGPEGELCSFDALVADCGLDDPNLHVLAKIVRGADTGKPDLTPQSAGLLAISLGLSVNYPDDHAMLEQGMIVYDALYAWIKSARAEVHNANLFRKS